LNKRSNACINRGLADAAARNRGSFGFENPGKRGIGLAGKASSNEMPLSKIAQFSNGKARR
jgi:hypothetical protein